MCPPCISMVSNCANPGCSKSLLRLQGGRIFGFRTTAKRIEHFWLCVRCAREFTLQHKDGKVELVRTHRKSA